MQHSAPHLPPPSLPHSKHRCMLREACRASPTKLAAADTSGSLIGALSQVSDMLGCQWGDEGKGKLVDILAQHFEIVARCQINGFSSLNLTKLDVLSDLEEIQLGVSYKLVDGTPIKSFLSDLCLLEQLKVEYEVLPGWKYDISSIRNYSDLPKAARLYVERIEELVGVPIHYIGIGPGCDALIYK
ncbi:hypothetical protein JHK87_049778 [Glycine soja]|nr:hypothetical protein JHK87_049778 [Glycine soja]